MQPMKADERRRDVLGTPYTEYEPRSGILYRLKTSDQWSGSRYLSVKSPELIYRFISPGASKGLHQLLTLTLTLTRSEPYEPNLCIFKHHGKGHKSLICLSPTNPTKPNSTNTNTNSNANVFYIHIMVMGGYYQGYLEFQDTYWQHFNGYTHVCEVMQFNGVVDDTTGCRVIPEIDMAGTQTGFLPNLGNLLPV